MTNSDIVAALVQKAANVARQTWFHVYAKLETVPDPDKPPKLVDIDLQVIKADCYENRLNPYTQIVTSYSPNQITIHENVINSVAEQLFKMIKRQKHLIITEEHEELVHKVIMRDLLNGDFKINLKEN